jgi:hypothetical protein
MIVLVIKILALIFTQLIRIWMQIQGTIIMRIHADADEDPQHCFLRQLMLVKIKYDERYDSTSLLAVTYSLFTGTVKG